MHFLPCSLLLFFLREQEEKSETFLTLSLSIRDLLWIEFIQEWQSKKIRSDSIVRLRDFLFLSSSVVGNHSHFLRLKTRLFSISGYDSI